MNAITSTNSSMAVSQTSTTHSMSMNSELQDQSQNKDKGQLPETGQVSTTNNSGLIAAATAILGGLGFIRKSKKDQKKEQADQ
ncbi:LPXTG cell wall anchor domain-containing protein [Staphylococcus americanisciuri]|nr:LPXTG cell wall anchor domain-containing protein [Staphylococcus americanisciuri]